MLKAVTFDLWDTMICDESDEPKRVAQGLRPKPAERRHLLWQALSDLAPIAPEAVAEAYDEADADFRKAWHEDAVTWTIDERLRQVLDRLERELPAETLAEVIRAHEEMELAVTPDSVEGIAEALAGLALRFRLSVVSDTIFSPARTLRRLLDLHGLKDFFAGFAFSDEVGRSKPHPAIFESAAEQLGVEPSEMLHIGDREDKDVRGAKALGMKAILFVGVRDRGRDGTAADAVCERAADLPEIIERLAAATRIRKAAPVRQAASPDRSRASTLSVSNRARAGVTRG